MYSSHVVHVDIFAFGPFSSVIVFVFFKKKKKTQFLLYMKQPVG